jgi:hypothetical protein
MNGKISEIGPGFHYIVALDRLAENSFGSGAGSVAGLKNRFPRRSFDGAKLR